VKPARRGKQRGREPADQPEPPLTVNGWRLYVWRDFRDRWRELRRAVEALRRKDPAGYQSAPAAKFLKTVRDLVLTEIPSDPGAERYRQGNTLGTKNRHWRRAKFHGRFRLFFQYSEKHRIIVYVWLNDDGTLRKEGARTDPYVVFQGMLARGAPPSDWDALLVECESWKSGDVT
jgi:toxin YhaV